MIHQLESSWMKQLERILVPNIYSTKKKIGFLNWVKPVITDLGFSLLNPVSNQTGLKPKAIQECKIDKFHNAAVNASSFVSL